MYCCIYLYIEWRRDRRVNEVDGRVEKQNERVTTIRDGRMDREEERGRRTDRRTDRQTDRETDKYREKITYIILYILLMNFIILS